MSKATAWDFFLPGIMATDRPSLCIVKLWAREHAHHLPEKADDTDQFTAKYLDGTALNHK